MRLELSEPENADMAADVAAELGGMRFLRGANAAALEALLATGSLLELARGEEFARESGETAQYLYLLLEGRLQVRSGARLIGRFEHSGDVAGELAALQTPPISACLISESNSRVLALPTVALGQPEHAAIAALVYPRLAFGLGNLLRALSARAQHRIDRAASEYATDPKTGLANRKLLQEFLGALVTARNGLDFCVAVARINTGEDGSGTPDEAALRRFADFLRTSIREGDLAARYDDTAFALVLPNCDAANAQNVASGLRSSLAKLTRDEAGAISAAFGIASSRDETDIGRLLKRADDAADRAQMGAGVAYLAGEAGA